MGVGVAPTSHAMSCAAIEGHASNFANLAELWRTICQPLQPSLQMALSAREADYYLSREGKPTGTLLVIGFEASKLAKEACCTAAKRGGRSRLSSLSDSAHQPHSGG
jgi:hypothetical protein